jgi:hypothetical protein
MRQPSIIILAYVRIGIMVKEGRAWYLLGIEKTTCLERHRKAYWIWTYKPFLKTMWILFPGQWKAHS